ncbi:MAG: FAD-dependent oxidoreductase [Deltaproteobacteria bacterium]|nr:FAD-dependent oxidoreductase [Deltaproteobacteria bacterium]
MNRKVIVIGAVALGSKAACRFKRLMPDAQVTLIDSDEQISYGGCGIPYYISGDISNASELRSTSFHRVRDEAFFREDKGVDVMTGTTALSIDRDNKSVRIRMKTGEEKDLPYDKLVIATGARPRKLDIPGFDKKNVFAVGSLNNAIAIKSALISGKVEKAVIIGGGFIGLEMAEAISDMWEIETHVVEYCDQIMPGFVSKNLSIMAKKVMEEKGIFFHLGESVREIQGADAVAGVRTDNGILEADMVISAVGIAPDSDLALRAGLELSDYGHIVVNDRMQTSDPDIYSGGDCVTITNLVTGKPGYFPLGSMANRQGRVIGSNLAGIDARFPGAVGSFSVKTFDYALAGAGLTIEKAIKEGIDAASIQVAQFDRAHFYPEKDIIFLELVVDRKTRRVLGIQGFGGKDSGMIARINSVATLLHHHITVEEISNLEFTYSPPFASAMDIVNALGNAAENYLDGRLRPIQASEFLDYWNQRDSGKCFFLDCRAAADGLPIEEKYRKFWKSIPHDELQRRMDEVPKDKKLILICNTGVRSYETQINLESAGIKDTANLCAGMAGLRACGIEV